MLQKDMIPPLKGANYVGHEDGSSKFFRNFGTCRQYYSAQQHNKENFVEQYSLQIIS